MNQAFLGSLCRACRHGREIVSGAGSRFLLCRLAATDRSYPKYPPQPVARCGGFEAKPEHDSAAPRDR